MLGMATGPHRWLFVDMNAYFASVEQQDRPELRGRPVGVVPVADTDRTCVIAASYEAKRAGVKTGTRVGDARRLCPGLVLVKARPRFYVQVHQRILRAVEQVAPIERVYSIDEWAVRLLGRERDEAVALGLGRRCKQAIAQQVGDQLRCSVGVAPTRLLAKIACELEKPDGLTALPPEALPGRLLHLSPDDLPGISRGVLRRLYRHGVTDIAGLWNMPREEARRVWGSVQGEHWWCGFHGLDMPEVKTHRSTMGHAHVLPPEFRSEEGAHAILTRLLHKAAHRLRHHGYFAHALHAFVDYGSRGLWNDSVALPACQDTLTLVEHLERLWRRRPPSPPGAPPLKVGVTLGDLTSADQTPGLLFPPQRHRQALGRVFDRVNQRFGGHTLYLGGMHRARHAMDDKIAFGRVPDEPSLL